MCGGGQSAPPPEPEKVQPTSRPEAPQTANVVSPGLRALSGNDDQAGGTLGGGSMGQNARPVTMLGSTRRM